MRGCKNNNIGTLILTKVDGNSLIGVLGYYHILPVPHQPTDELVNPSMFAFEFR
jgi:hypothetical protein